MSETFACSSSKILMPVSSTGFPPGVAVGRPQEDCAWKEVGIHQEKGSREESFQEKETLGETEVFGEEKGSRPQEGLHEKKRVGQKEDQAGQGLDEKEKEEKRQKNVPGA